MGNIGQAFTPTLPSVDDLDWGPTVNAVVTELIDRVDHVLDSDSIALTTGDVKHGTRIRHLGPASAKGSSGATWTPASGGASSYWAGTGASDVVEWDLDLDRGERLTAVRVTGRANGTTAWSCKAWLNTTSTGARTQLGDTVSSATAAAIEEKNITSSSTTWILAGTTVTLADGQFVSVEWISGASGNRALALEYDSDRQAT